MNRKYYNCLIKQNNTEQNKKVFVKDESLSDEQLIKNIKKYIYKQFNVIPYISGPFFEEDALSTEQGEKSQQIKQNNKFTYKNVTLINKKITGTYKKWRIIGYHIEEDPYLIYTIFLTNPLNNKLGPELISINKISQEK